MFIYRLQDPNQPRKYFKRGELLAKEQEEYFKKYGSHTNQDETEETEASFDKGEYSEFLIFSHQFFLCSVMFTLIAMYH